MSERDRAAGPDEPRDPALDRTYAAGAREEPPSRLDSAILAAARREVHAGPRGLGAVLHRWRTPVALAAVLVLSVSVVLLMREEGAHRLAESPAPLRAPSSSTEGKVSADKERTADKEQERTADRDRRTQVDAPPALVQAPKAVPPKEDTRSVLRDAPMPQAAPSEDYRRKEERAPAARQEADRDREVSRPAPRPFAEPSTEPKLSAPELPPPADGLAKRAQPGALAGQALERAEREHQPAQRAPAPPALATPEANAGAAAPPAARAARPATPDSSGKDLVQEQMRNDAAASRPVWQGYESQPPERWLERVEELHRAGRSTDAREMLAEFRKRFPQYAVPATLNR